MLLRNFSTKTLHSLPWLAHHPPDLWYDAHDFLTKKSGLISGTSISYSSYRREERAGRDPSRRQTSGVPKPIAAPPYPTLDAALAASLETDAKKTVARRRPGRVTPNDVEIPPDSRSGKAARAGVVAVNRLEAQLQTPSATVNTVPATPTSGTRVQPSALASPDSSSTPPG